MTATSILLRRAALSLIALVLSADLASAQQAPIIYPANGQTMDQQAGDEGQCRNIATQATGVTPDSAPQQSSSGYSSPGMVGGAARGAALGAMGGAIAGDAGKGAAAGAAMGATVGVVRRSRERRQQAATNQQAYNSYQADLTKYYQSFAACMASRGYQVR